MPPSSTHSKLYRAVGKRVRSNREAARLTQEQLAKKVGVSRTSITNLEAGRQKMALHSLHEIASTLGIELKELIPAEAELAGEDLVTVVVDGAASKVPPGIAEAVESLMGTAQEGGE